MHAGKYCQLWAGCGTLLGMNGSTTADREPGMDTPASASSPVYEFAPAAASPDDTTAPAAMFRLDPANRLLTCSGKEVPLPGRAFDALEMLVQRPGQLVTKEELMAHIWAGSFVEESNLTVAISTLRRALNEDPQDRRYIQTVARRGYRLIAQVREVHNAPVPLTPQASSLTPPASYLPPLQDHARSESTVGRSRKPSRLHAFALLGALLIACLLAVCWWLLKPRETIQTLAVLPFTAESGTTAFAGAGEAAEIVLLGMTDTMVQRLEPQLIVRPTSSMLRYSEGPPPDPTTAGREQGVDAVMTGTLSSRGRMPRLRLRLVRVSDGRTLWQDTFAGDQWQDLAQVVDHAAGRASRELKKHAANATPSALTRPAPANGPAYQLYLRGRYFWNRRTVDGLRKSVDYFRQSIAADPNYAPAYAGLADSYALLASFSVEPGAAANVDARSAAFSAIHLDPTLAEPHASLGMIYFFTDWDPHAAEAEFERAIQLNPNYATAHHWYALDLAAMGRFPQALYEIRLAQKLDPLSLIIGTNVGWIEYLARDYPAAVTDLERVLELDPNFARARTRLGTVEMAQGDFTAAAGNFARAMTPTASGKPGSADDAGGDTFADPFVQGLLGDAEARAGKTAAAEGTLAALRSRSASQYVPPISRGLVLLGLNRRTEALAEFAKSVDEHSTSMVYARVDPALDDLRRDPAFQALLARMKF